MHSDCWKRRDIIRLCVFLPSLVLINCDKLLFTQDADGQVRQG